jgi:hypothetical protein
MLSAASLPLQVPNLRDVPVDLEDLSGRVKKVAAAGPKRAKGLAAEGQKRAMDLASRTPLVPARKRSRLSLAWPVLAVLAGIGLLMVIRSRRPSTTDTAQSAPSGAYARN